MSDVTPKQHPHIWSQKRFIGVWCTWQSKGHDPLQNLSSWVFPQDDGSNLYAVGIQDYVSLDDGYAIFPCDKPYKTRTQAFAAIGRALTKLDKLMQQDGT